MFEVKRNSDFAVRLSEYLEVERSSEPSASQTDLNSAEAHSQISSVLVELDFGLKSISDPEFPSLEHADTSSVHVHVET